MNKEQPTHEATCLCGKKVKWTPEQEKEFKKVFNKNHKKAVKQSAVLGAQAQKLDNLAIFYWEQMTKVMNEGDKMFNVLVRAINHAHHYGETK